jgi:hypothetical protein
MIFGTGFPAFRGGLLRYADALGVSHVTERLQRLAETHGSRFQPSEPLQRRAKHGERFYPER